MSEAMEKAGSVANEAGLSYENYIALAGKVAEMTRMEGTQVGTMMKSIFARTSRSKSADEDVTDEDRSNASKAYASVGISLYNDKGEYKDYTETLNELTEVWDDLSDAQRAYIAEQSAGTRGINVFNAMIETWQDAKELANSALEDTDFIDETQEKYMESMEAHLNTLKASFQEFWATLLDTGAINSLIDSIANLSVVLQGAAQGFSNVWAVIQPLLTLLGEGFNAIGKITGGISEIDGGLSSLIVTLGLLYTSVKTISSLKNGEGIKESLTGSFKNLKDLLIKQKEEVQSLETAETAKSTMANQAETASELEQTAAKEANVAATKELNAVQQQENVTTAQSTAENVKETASELEQAATKSSSKLGGLTDKLTGLWSSLTTFGKISVVAIGIYSAIKVFNNLTDTVQETQEKFSEFKSEYEDKLSSLNEGKKTVDSLKNEYAELSKGVSKSGQNLTLTTEEFERYHEICNQIADIYPTLVSGYDSEGNAILNLKGNLEGLTEAYKNAQLETARFYVNNDNKETLDENWNNASGNRSWNTKLLGELSDLFGDTTIGNSVTSKEVVDALKELQDMDLNEAVGYIASLSAANRDLYDWLSENGITEAATTNEKWAKQLRELPALIETAGGDLTDAANAYKEEMQNWLKIYSMDSTSYPEYKNLDSSVIDNISTLINSTTTEQIEKLKDQGIEFNEYVKSLMDTFANNPDTQISLNNLLNINEDASVEDLKKIIDENLDDLAKQLEYDDAAELKVKLGLEGSDEVIEQYDKLVNKITSKIESEKKDKIINLSGDNKGDADLYTRIEKSNSSTKNINSRLKKAGWDKSAEEAYKVYSQGDKSIVLTPILPDGSILSEESLDGYAKDILDGKEIDPDITLASFDGKDAEKQAKKFTKSIGSAEKSLKNADKNVKQFIKDNNINTKKEIELLNSIIDETDTWAEAMEQYKLQSIDIAVNDTELESLKSNLAEVEKTITNVNSAITSSASSKGLSSDEIKNISTAFESLKGYDYDKLFESTAEGIHLNVQELERLNGEYKKSEGEKYSKELSKLKDEYATTCVAIDDAADSTERLELINKKNSLANQIKEAQELQSQYEGLTNAVTQWQQAKEGAEEGDNYDSIADGISNIKKLYDEGLVGTREFKTGVQMMTNEDLSGASIEKYLDAYKKQYDKFNSYFTGDATGLNNFLNDVHNLNDEWSKLVYQNADGSWDITADIEKLSSDLGISQAAIEEIFKKLNDYGFDIDFREETDYLKNLREEAEAASAALGEDYKIDLTVSGDDAIHEQIKAAEELQKGLSEDSEEYKNIGKEIEYLKAKAGETAECLDFDINYEDDKDELDEIVKRLKDIEGFEDLKIDFKTDNLTNVDNQLEDVTTKLLDLKGKDTVLDLSQKGATELVDIFNALLNKKTELNEPVVMQLNSNDFESEYQNVVTLLQEYQTAVDKLNTTKAQVEIGIKTEADEQSAQKEVDNLVAKINGQKGKTAEVLTNLKLKPGSLDQTEIDSKLSSMNYDILVGAKFDPAGLESIKEAKASATKKIDIKVEDAAAKTSIGELTKKATKKINVSLSGVETAKDSISSLTKSATKKITVKVKAEGADQLNGNAHANGNANKGILSRGKAFARGVWGAAQTGISLVGELGHELIVRGDNWFTVGDNGAEFAEIKKGDIVFNHKQTEEIFKNGYVTSNGGRGQIANVNGNAYASGTYTTYGSLPGSNKFYNNAVVSKKKYNKTSNKSSNSSSNNNAADEADQFLETYDWVEIAIDRLERKIDELDTIASSAYKSFSKRNNTLAQEFSRVTEEIQLQSDAYNVYMQKANSIGLSETYASKVRNGTLQIEDITDENLSDKIKDYQEWYEKALDCSDAITELKETLADITSDKFDNIADEFEAQLDEIEHRINGIETGLDIVEAKGQFASRQYYEMLMDTEKENISLIQKEYEALQQSFNEAMSTGTIEQYSEQWYDMKQEINDVEEAYQDAQKALIEYKNEMWKMDWSVFEKTQEYIEDITKESEFLIDLLSLNENDLFSKTSGKLNDYGNTVGGLHAVNYDVYMAQADEYKNKIESINKELANDPTNSILLDKKQEYIEAQREAIQNAQDEKDAVKDLISESYERMLDILNELIEKRKDALDAEKDLYDYEKDVKEQTKEIADLRKQLLSITGDDSEEAKSKRQQLQTSLNEAESDLQETEYEKWLSDQERLLDDLYDEYEQVLNERLDNIDLLMSEMIENTNANSEIINQTIKDATTDVGYDLTSSMKTIWDDSTIKLTNVVSEYNSNFTSTLTTTNEAIKKIYELINRNVKNADKEIDENVGNVKPDGNTGGNTVITPTPTPTPTPTSPQQATTSNKGSFFVYKADSYPKSKLNKENSVVDRLKWHNFDSSFSRRASYYQSMGLGSASSYKGSSSQNVAMINWMRNNGFRRDGQLTSMINQAQEDGLFLGRKDDTLLTPEYKQTVEKALDTIIDMSKYQPNTNAITGVNNLNNTNNIEMNFNLPNVTDPEDFLDYFQKSQRAQKIVQSMTIGSSLGGNSLDKYKYKR